MAITCEVSFYIPQFDRDVYNASNARVEGEEVTDDEAVEEAFEVVAEVPKRVSLKSFYHLSNNHQTLKTAKLVGDCFIYITSTGYAPLLVPSPTLLVPSTCSKASFFIPSRS